MARADAKAGRFFSGIDGSFVPVRAAHESSEDGSMMSECSQRTGDGDLWEEERKKMSVICFVRVLYTQLIYVFQAYLFPQLYCGVRVFQGIRGCGALSLTIQGD